MEFWGFLRGGCFVGQLQLTQNIRYARKKHNLVSHLSSGQYDVITAAFITLDNKQEGWLPPTKRASAAKIN